MHLTEPTLLLSKIKLFIIMVLWKRRLINNFNLDFFIFLNSVFTLFKKQLLEIISLSYLLIYQFELKTWIHKQTEQYKTSSYFLFSF